MPARHSHTPARVVALHLCVALSWTLVDGKATGCPAWKVSDRPKSAQETQSGRFVPYSDIPALLPHMPNNGCMRCWELPDACLEILPVPPAKLIYDDPRSNSMGVGIYRRNKRPFRLHVAGMSRPDFDATVNRLTGFVKDPLNSQFLRHIERDIFFVDPHNKTAWPLFGTPASQHRGTRPASSKSGPGGDDELVMMWPMWEKGYGDVIANLLLPFGELLRHGAPPRNLALSGIRHAALLPPLRASTAHLCATEREHLPMLPRCQSACWPRVRLCASEFFESTRDSWRATAALDAAASSMSSPIHGDRRHNPTAAVSAAIAAALEARNVSSTRVSRLAGGNGDASSGRRRHQGRPSPSALRVLIASRSGRRLLANDRELARACDGQVIDGMRLACTLLPAAASPAAKIAALRATNVYICVWGGDTVHSLHMRFGSAIVELRPSGFAEGAPWNWLELHRRWVTRLEDRDSRPLHFYPLLLPRNASIINSTESECFNRNRRRRERLRRENRSKIPQDDWLCYWNADLEVNFDLVRPALASYAAYLHGRQPLEQRGLARGTRRMRREGRI